MSDEATQINDRYNARIAEISDFEPGDTAFSWTGKRIPYIGWMWRDVDFAGRRIPVGNTGTYKGIMESNKWGYPERLMTEEEATKFIGYLDAAFAKQDWGAKEQAEQIWAELRAWFQTLTIEEQEP